jgi:hypothetical protein
MLDAIAVWLPRRVIKRCPATIFAISRTARVPGRIKFLIVSISTINGMSGPGVLWGTRWANMCLVWLTHPNSIKEIHRGSLRVRVIVKWLEAVKMYGNNPIKLFSKMNRNRLINRVVLPWKDSGPNKFLNS